MDSPKPTIIEPRNLLYKWNIIKLEDRFGKEHSLVVVEVTDYWLILDEDWATINFPQAFFEKQEDWSYRIMLN